MAAVMGQADAAALLSHGAALVDETEAWWEVPCEASSAAAGEELAEISPPVPSWEVPSEVAEIAPAELAPTQRP